MSKVTRDYLFFCGPFKLTDSSVSTTVIFHINTLAETSEFQTMVFCCCSVIYFDENLHGGRNVGRERLNYNYRKVKKNIMLLHL